MELRFGVFRKLEEGEEERLCEGDAQFGEVDSDALLLGDTLDVEGFDEDPGQAFLLSRDVDHLMDPS